MHFASDIDRPNKHEGRTSLKLILMAVMMIMQSAVISASTNLSKSVENIYMYHKDQAVLNLDEYIIGDGSQVSIESNSPNAEVDKKVMDPVIRTQATLGCWGARMFPTDPNYMYLLCPNNLLIKTSVSIASKNVDNNKLQIASSEYECHTILISPNMQSLIAICLSAKNETNPKGSQIMIQFIDSRSMLSVNTYIDAQVSGENITFSAKPLASESQILARLEGRMLLLASAEKSKEFKIYTVEQDNQLTSVQRYGLGSNILDSELPFNHMIEKCMFEELMADFDYLYIIASCDDNFRKYFCRCTQENNSKSDGKDLKCIKKECFFREFSSNLEYGFSVKILKRITGKNGDSVYFFNGTALFLRDFGKLISKEMFRFNDITLINKKFFTVKEVVLMGKLLHLVVLIQAQNSTKNMLDMISVSVARQYYRRINLLKGNYPNAAVQFVAENPASFSLHQVVVQLPTIGTTFLFEDNSILSIKFILETSNKQSLLSKRRLQSRQSDHQNYDGDSSPFIVIPVEFSITASGMMNMVSLNLNVLVDENDSGKLDLPQEFVFYDGSLPLTLPLSKQSIQGYSPNLSVTGSIAMVHKIEYVSPVEVKLSSKDLFPANKMQFFHLDNNFFLLQSKEILKIVEFKANRNEKSSQFSERQSITMSQGSQFLDAISSDDLRVYVLVKTGETSVSLIIMNSDGTILPEIPFTLANAGNVLLGAINIFNVAIELDVLIRVKGSNEIELHILNAPSTDIEKKVASFKVYPFLPKNICPKSIEWANRRLPYLYIESDCEGKYTIFEIFLESIRESEAPITNFFLNSENTINISLCAYDKNLMLINRKTKLVQGMDRLTEFNPKIRYYPLQEYDVADITRYHCDHANPFLGILGPDISGTLSKIVLYRVEESGDNSLRRVHSVLKLNKLYSPNAELVLHTDPDGIKGYITVLDNGEIEQFIFNLAVPSITIQSIGSPSGDNSLTFQLSVEPSNESEGHPEKLASTANLRLINQSFAGVGYLIAKQPVLKEAEYSIEDQFKFDGLFLKSYLEIEGKPATTDNLQKKGIVSFTDRKTKLDVDPNKIISENSPATNIIIEKNIAFAWNSLEFTIYDQGEPKLRYDNLKFEIKSVHFMKVPDRWASGETSLWFPKIAFLETSTEGHS